MEVSEVLLDFHSLLMMTYQCDQEWFLTSIPLILFLFLFFSECLGETGREKIRKKSRCRKERRHICGGSEGRNIWANQRHTQVITICVKQWDVWRPTVCGGIRSQKERFSVWTFGREKPSIGWLNVWGRKKAGNWKDAVEKKIKQKRSYMDCSWGKILHEL